jgi:Sigma-70 region 2
MERLEIGVLMSEQAATAIFTRERLDSVLSELRPKLHRYCARMTGSVIDAEDIVQEKLSKLFPKQDRLLTRKAGSFALRTIRRSIFFGGAPGRRPLVPRRIPKWLLILSPR